MAILFGGAGICAVTFLVIRDVRWFPLYWRILLFFARSPFVRLKEAVKQG